MEMKDLVFFIICSSLVLLDIFICIGLCTQEYISDYADRREQSVFSYIGWCFAFMALSGFLLVLVLMLISLFFGIDSYSMSYLGKFLKSELFLTILLIVFIGFCIWMYVVGKAYSFVDVFHYRNIRSKIRGLEKALEHSEKALKDVEKEIDKANRNGLSDKVLKELNDNKSSLAKSYENYLIKYKHLENIKVKLGAKIKENNIDL